jgi:hypothetical protein
LGDGTRFNFNSSLYNAKATKVRRRALPAQTRSIHQFVRPMALVVRARGVVLDRIPEGSDEGRACGERAERAPVARQSRSSTSGVPTKNSVAMTPVTVMTV